MHIRKLEGPRRRGRRTLRKKFHSNYLKKTTRVRKAATFPEAKVNQRGVLLKVRLGGLHCEIKRLKGTGPLQMVCRPEVDDDWVAKREGTGQER